jgi:ribonuclease R
MKKKHRKGQGLNTNPSRPSSKDSPKSSKESGRSNKKIKNARGLSDVLRTGGSRSSNPRITHGDIRPPSGAGDREKPALSKKLTYIMNFQPPDQTPAQTPAQIPGQTPERSGGKPAQSGPPISAPPRPEIVEFGWPKERVKPKASQEGRRGFTEDRVSEKSKKGERVTGIVKRHPDGFGFLIPDKSGMPDVYISRHSMTGVMTNDRVEVSVYKPKTNTRERDDRLAGEIIRVLNRAHQRVVGKYLPVDQRYGIIQDDNRGWGTDLRIASEHSMNAKENDLVVVEVLQFPDSHHEFIGKVVGLMGDIEDPLNDVMRIIHQAGIPTEFSATAHGEAKRFGGEVTPAEMAGREDLTEIGLITIDGVTARDFDDAVYTEQTGSGFRLIVGIADVSHYVKPGSTLDHEAYERGTSTYFPNFVVPMLPEELSNELCSLKPKVKRLCFACEMQINFDGVVENFRFFEAVMESKARVTYGEAQEVIDGRTPPALKDVADNIRRSADLAKILMQKRFREGSLDLEIPETQVVVDTSGESVDIIRSERLFAHRLIEELMLVTNICTARFLDEAEIPGIYRIHEEPDPDNLQSLQRYLWNFGGTKSVMGGRLQKKLTKALQSMEGRPEAQILNILTLRTMKQAHYSENNVGHFGLGFSHYTHFTSPIRRYPDLIAHRLIKSQLYAKYRGMQMSDEELASATTMLSACEQRSTKAERQLISIKKARFIRKFIGQEFEGIISSVAKFGCFVMLRQYDVDGLIKVENLGKDRFEYDSENLRLIGTRSGLQYTIGDTVKVQVMGADPELGKVDFELAAEARAAAMNPEPRSEPRKKQKGSKDVSQKGGAKKEKFDPRKRRSSEDDRRGVRKERVSKRRRKD